MNCTAPKPPRSATEKPPLKAKSILNNSFGATQREVGKGWVLLAKTALPNGTAETHRWAMGTRGAHLEGGLQRGPSPAVVFPHPNTRREAEAQNETQPNITHSFVHLTGTSALVATPPYHCSIPQLTWCKSRLL